MLDVVQNKFRRLTDTVGGYIWFATIEINSLNPLAREKRTENRRVLLLAAALPPDVGGGVYRPVALIKYGTRLGWTIGAISNAVRQKCSNVEAGEYLLKQIPTSVKIDRIDAPTLTPSYRWFPRVDGNFLQALAMTSFALKKYIALPPAYVIASGPTFHTFVTAYYCAQRWNAKLILDYRDEWTVGTPGFVHLGNADAFWEKRCLKRADKVIFATESFRQLYLSHFQDLPAQKCHVVHNGWDPEHFHESETIHVTSPRDRFVISFIGRCVIGHLPGEFLGVLQEMFKRWSSYREKLTVQFVGYQCEEAKRQVAAFSEKAPGVVQLIPEVSKSEAIALGRASDALLLLNEPTEVMKRRIPGKLFEYMATNRPILAFGHLGEVGAIIKKTRAGLTVPVDKESLLNQALETLMRQPANSWWTKERQDWVEEHKRDVLAKRFFQIVADTESKCSNLCV